MAAEAVLTGQQLLAGLHVGELVALGSGGM